MTLDRFHKIHSFICFAIHISSHAMWKMHFSTQFIWLHKLHNIYTRIRKILYMSCDASGHAVWTTPEHTDPDQQQKWVSLSYWDAILHSPPPLLCFNDSQMQSTAAETHYDCTKIQETVSEARGLESQDIHEENPAHMQTHDEWAYMHCLHALLTCLHSIISNNITYNSCLYECCDVPEGQM